MKMAVSPVWWRLEAAKAVRAKEKEKATELPAFHLLPVRQGPR
jgi:hypothetical protein